MNSEFNNKSILKSTLVQQQHEPEGKALDLPVIPRSLISVEGAKMSFFGYAGTFTCLIML